MSLVTVITGPKLASIGAITLDASINEVHAESWAITKHPIEAGADITDHKRREPSVITMTAEISAAPIGLQFLAVPDPARPIDTWKQLIELADSEELVDVVTTLKNYESMQIESLRATRNAETGEVLAFVATLRQLFIVDAAFAERKAPQAKRRKGRKAKKQADPVQTQSIAGKLADFLSSATP